VLLLGVGWREQGTVIGYAGSTEIHWHLHFEVRYLEANQPVVLPALKSGILCLPGWNQVRKIESK
jgi:murein DD-endopeptidase MepM/ murein hydrolase activator NlpD